MLRHNIKIEEFVKVCSKCNNQFPKTPDFFDNSDDCVYCESGIEYKNETHEKKKKYLRDRQKIKIQNLEDEYVVSLLKDHKKIPTKTISQNKELINMKRIQVKLKREINKWKKN